MNSNPMPALDEPILRERYALLNLVCDANPPGVNWPLEEQLQHLERLIEQELPALARKGSPDNFADLLHALRVEMVRFREFCEYPDLPSKVVVGLGGSFSAGKSSLINVLLGDRKCLVTEVDPTTSLPTYLVQGQGDEIGVHAINHFNRKVTLSHAQFRTLTHDEKQLYGSQVSGLLKSVVVAHPALPWANLALLDTPGYSKAGEASSERTDANVARAQLNSAQFIVWLVPADKGSITEEDTAFLGSLDRNIPKLIVVSRADKHPPETITEIVALVKETLAKRGLAVLDVLPFSSRKSGFEVAPLLAYFANWNEAKRELGFAQQFKRQFMAYRRFIDDEKQEAQRLLGKFNRIMALTDDGDIQNDIGNVQRKCHSELEQLEKLAVNVAELQTSFFSGLKQIGEGVGIPLPEPDAMGLLEIGSVKLTAGLQALAATWGTKPLNIEPTLWAPLTDPWVNSLELKDHVYPIHYAASFDEGARSGYVALLLLICLDHGALSSEQQSLLDGWLSAMGLSGQLALHCELAANLSQDKALLEDTLRFIKADAQLAQAWLLDLLIIERIAKPLNKDIFTWIELFAGYYAIKHSSIEHVIYLAASALGLSIKARPVTLTVNYHETHFHCYQVWSELLVDYINDMIDTQLGGLLNWADEYEVDKSFFPREKQKLLASKSITIQGNDEFTQIPASLGLLTNLTSLSICGRGLLTLPDSIGKLTNLTSLSLVNCDSLRALPEWIGNLTKLTELSLFNCESICSLPDGIGKLKELNLLDLNYCKSLTSLPNSICELANLRDLYLPEGFTPPKKLNRLHDCHIGIG